jgi:hypothetical protein
MLRDARINTIGEGANDVLRAFTALVGMRDVGLELEGVLDAIHHPIGNFTRLGRFAGRKLGSLLVSPAISVSNNELEPDAGRLARSISDLGSNVERLLRTYQKEIVDRQYQLGRAADVAIELYVGACVLRRLDQMLRQSDHDDGRARAELEIGRYFLATSRRRIEQALAEMWDNDDEATTHLANRMLREG